MAPFKRLPGRIMGAAMSRLTQLAPPLTGEVGRALPDSKGGEEPKDLQRWRTDGYELFTTTIGESKLFYSADQWVRIKLTLETAGPVSIGIGRTDILPVLSGKGRILTTGAEWEVFIPKGTRVYYAAENVNRVATTIEPIPWMEQLSMEIRRVAQNVLSSAGQLVAVLGGKPAPATSSSSMPASLQRQTKLSQLTPMDVPGKVR